MHALVIDDSRATRSIIRSILLKLDYQVSEAANGLEALNRLRLYGCPDVALVDWNMPEMNGYEFIRAVRADEQLRDLPLIMVTTETELERMKLAFMAGVNEYLMKPFDESMIATKLSLLGLKA